MTTEKNLKLIQGSVDEIESLQGDDEAQHSREDALYLAVLKDIAGGAKDPEKLAREALKTQLIDFERWCE